MSDRYDRIYGQVHDLAVMSRPSTIVEALPIAGDVTTWILQSAAMDDGVVLFLQNLDAESNLRIVLPTRVVKAIVAQHDRLKERVTDRRSEARKAADAEREKLAAARRLLERKREERRQRRAAAEKGA